MSLFTRQSGGQRVLLSQDSETHSNNLVALAHVQLKPFYRLSTRDVTHVRKCTRPSPAFPYCKRRKAGRGLGTRLELRRVRVDCRKAFSRHVQVQRVRFDHSKACRRLVEVRRVLSVHREACIHLVEVRRVRFDFHKACRSSEHPFSPRQCVHRACRSSENPF